MLPLVGLAGWLLGWCHQIFDFNFNIHIHHAIFVFQFEAVHSFGRRLEPYICVFSEFDASIKFYIPSKNLPKAKSKALFWLLFLIFFFCHALHISFFTFNSLLSSCIDSFSCAIFCFFSIFLSVRFKRLFYIQLHSILFSIWYFFRAHRPSLQCKNERFNRRSIRCLV